MQISSVIPKPPAEFSPLTIAKSIKYIDGKKMQFDIIFSKRAYKVRTNLLGKHNVYNILSAISVSLYLGISISKAIQSLKSFYGASRRFDIYKNIKNLTCLKKDIQKYKRFNTFRVIGMGGSILGAEAIYFFLKIIK